MHIPGSGDTYIDVQGYEGLISEDTIEYDCPEKKRGVKTYI